MPLSLIFTMKKILKLSEKSYIYVCGMRGVKRALTTVIILLILQAPVFAKEFQTITVKKEKLYLFSKIPAFVIPKNSVVISSKLMGFVKGLKVDVGDRVKKGEVLLEIESKSIKEKIKQVKANLENASFNYHKIKKLYKEGVVPKRSFVAAKSAYEQAKAALKDVKTLVSYSIIRSPITGYVSKKFIQNGDLAAPSQPLIAVEGTDTYQIQANIANNLYPYILKMEKIPVVIGNRKIYGKLQYIQKSEDPISHTHLAKILIPKKDYIHPGEFAIVLIKKNPINAIIISKKAIIERGGVRGVFVVGKDNRVHFRMLRLGEKTDGKYVVLSGLNAGERVILNPPYYIVNNLEVK